MQQQTCLAHQQRTRGARARFVHEVQLSCAGKAKRKRAHADADDSDYTPKGEQSSNGALCIHQSHEQCKCILSVPKASQMQMASARSAMSD